MFIVSLFFPLCSLVLMPFPFYSRQFRLLVEQLPKRDKCTPHQHAPQHSARAKETLTKEQPPLASKLISGSERNCSGQNEKCVTARA
jgi:hypothetical protein